MNYKRIGKAIKERMVELGISEEDLARDCNIDLALVNSIIIGEEVASIEVLTLISIYLDMSFNDLLDTKKNKELYMNTLKKSIKRRRKNWTINLMGAIGLCLILCVIEAILLLVNIPSKYSAIVFVLITVLLLIVDICLALNEK